MRLRLALLAFAFFPALAFAQQRPVFDVDDYVDPRHYEGRVFASRLAAGGAMGFIDDYRPRHHGASFLHLMNSLYWSQWQFDYKRSEIWSGPSPSLQMCNCIPPVFFPTPPSSESTPEAPPSGHKDTLQAAFYAPWPRAGQGAAMLRYRLTLARQPIDTAATFSNTSVVATHLRGHEQSVGLDADTYLGFFGTLHYARTVRSGTAADRRQQEITYTALIPGWLVGNVLVRSTVTAGAVTGRGGTALNVVNPSLEGLWRQGRTRVNFHVVYSPQATRSGAGGWETHHQIALFADWGKVWLFKKHASSS